VATNGADGHIMTFASNPSGAVPTLLLTTTGRRSGEKFVFPLIYGTTGDSYVVVASKGGVPDHPGWYRNLVSDPRVDVQVASEQFQASARSEEDACRPEKNARPPKVLAPSRRRPCIWIS